MVARRCSLCSNRGIVSPTATTCYQPHSALLNSEVSRDFGLGHPLAPTTSVHLSHLPCDLEVDLRSFAAQQILVVCHWLQMGWVDARWNTAEMIEIETCRDSAVDSLPRKTVSEYVAAKSPVSQVVGRFQPDVTGRVMPPVLVAPKNVTPFLFPPQSCLMPLTEAFRLSFHPAPMPRRVCGDWRKIIAAALTQLRVRIGHRVGLLHGLMSGSAGLDSRAPTFYTVAR